MLTERLDTLKNGGQFFVADLPYHFAIVLTDELEATYREIGNEAMTKVESLIDAHNVTLQDAQQYAESIQFTQPAINATRRKGYSVDGMRSDLSRMYRITGAGIQTLKHYEKTSDRASPSISGEINVGKNFRSAIHYHEVGHHVEFSNAYANRACLQFLVDRWQKYDQQVSRLKDLSQLNYKATEYAIVDGFTELYVGKVYFATPGRKAKQLTSEDIYRLEATEVLSMGFQMFVDPMNLGKFIASDKDHFRLTLGIMKKIGELPLVPVFGI